MKANRKGRRSCLDKEDKLLDTDTVLADETLLHIFQNLDTARDLTCCMFVCKRWFNVASDDILWKKISEQQFGPRKAGANATEDDQISWREAYAQQAIKRLKWRQAFAKDNNGASLLDARVFQSKLVQYCKKKRLKITESWDCLLGVVGTTGVGKTCLLISATELRFPKDYVPTVFDGFVACLDSPLATKGIGFSFCDTVGQGHPWYEPERYKRFHMSRFPGCEVFMACFAVDDWASFDALHSKVIPEVRTCTNAPIVVIATKTDLRDVVRDCISFEEGAGMAIQVGAVGYVETDATQQKSSLGDLNDMITFLLHVAAAHHLNVLPSLILRHSDDGEKRCSLQ